jgi:large subunit ribosomal protein L24
MKIKHNDKVMVISGKDKGKTGKVLRMLTKSGKIVVEKLNMRTKHVKKTKTAAGEKIHFEAPMDASNVAIVCPACNKPTRAGYKILENGKKERICKKCRESMDRELLETGTKSKSAKKIPKI